MIDATDGAMADVLQIGGMQGFTTAGTIFINAGGSTDGGCMSNTPSGQFGLCYSTSSANYAAFNNTGHAVTMIYQDQRAWPVN